jgi:OOP family OmpA-OmpF porin
MKKVSVVVLSLLFGLLSASLFAAQKDAAGCKDHPLIPRIPGYSITGCSDAPASFDADIQNGKNTETMHIEGKSVALLYGPGPDLKSKPTEPELRGHFEDAVKKQGGGLVGATPGQKWPIYKIVKNGKEYWVVLMVDSGSYYTGSYAYRIIEK